MALRRCPKELKLTEHKKGGTSAQGRTEYICQSCGNVSGLTVTEINALKVERAERRKEDLEFQEKLDNRTGIFTIPDGGREGER